MGGLLSTLSQSNPTSSASSDTIAFPDPSQAPKTETEMESKLPESENSIHPPQYHTTAEINENPSVKEESSLLEEKVPENSIQEGDADGEGEEEEEESECGFCLFMKAGGCRETFVEWENCVKEGDKNDENIVEKCIQATANLRKCMEANSDYYGPLLQAEKDAEEEVAKQLEEEKQSAVDGSGNDEKEEEKQSAVDGSGNGVKEEALGNSEEKQAS